MRRYSDPLDAIWLDLMDRLGWRVERTTQVYASWNGKGTLFISVPEDFDPDDCLAQMLLHELCHALVAGPGCLDKPDWGMENTDSRDLAQEHACHRLQAALTGPHGLRDMLRPTTDHRPYYEALPADPLRPGKDPAIVLAREGFIRGTQGPWAEPLADALKATAALADILRPHAAGTIWAESRPPHPTGMAPAESSQRSCGDCAWMTAERACQHAGVPVQADWPACLRWEAVFGEEACPSCGACCHRGFDVVDLDPDEALVTARPDWIDKDRWGLHLPRPDGHCVALNEDAPWRCTVYEQRPRNCAELEVRGSACLSARQRAGIGP